MISIIIAYQVLLWTLSYGYVTCGIGPRNELVFSDGLGVVIHGKLSKIGVETTIRVKVVGNVSLPIQSSLRWRLSQYGKPGNDIKVPTRKKPLGNQDDTAAPSRSQLARSLIEDAVDRRA